MYSGRVDIRMKLLYVFILETTYVDGAESWVLHSQGKNSNPVWTQQESWLVFVSPTTHSLLKFGVSNMPLVGLLIADGRDQNLLHDGYVNLWCLRLCACAHFDRVLTNMKIYYCDASKTRGVQLET